MKVNLQNRTGNATRNAAVGIASKMVEVLSSMACRMIFVRCLTASYLGVSGLFSNILSFLSMAELGVGSAIVFELYSALTETDNLKKIQLMDFFRRAYTLIGCFIGAAGLCVIPFLGRLVSVGSDIRESIYLLYCLYLTNTVVSYFFSYKASLLTAAQQNYLVTVVKTVSVILQNILQCAVLLLTGSFVLYLLIQIGCLLLNNIMISMTADRVFPWLKEKPSVRLDSVTSKRLFRNIRYKFTESLSHMLIHCTDSIIITALGGLAVNGLNSNYELLCSTLITFTTQIQNGMGGGIGNVMAVETKEIQEKTFRRVNFLYFWLFAWCAICYVLLAQDVVGLFFGAGYVMEFGIPLATGLYFYLFQQYQCVASFKIATGLFKYGRWMGLVVGVVNVVLSVLLGQRMGVVGVLLASSLSVLISRWYTPFILYKKHFDRSPMGFYWIDLGYMLQLTVYFIITWKLCAMVQFSCFFNLICKGVICTIVPNVLFVCMNRRKEEFSFAVEKLNGIVRRIHR